MRPIVSHRPSPLLVNLSFSSVNPSKPLCPMLLFFLPQHLLLSLVCLLLHRQFRRRLTNRSSLSRAPLSLVLFLVRQAHTKFAQLEVAPTTRPPSFLSRAFLPLPSASRSYRFWVHEKIAKGKNDWMKELEAIEEEGLLDDDERYRGRNTK